MIEFLQRIKILTNSSVGWWYLSKASVVLLLIWSVGGNSLKVLLHYDDENSLIREFSVKRSEHLSKEAAYVQSIWLYGEECNKSDA